MIYNVILGPLAKMSSDETRRAHQMNTAVASGNIFNFISEWLRET